MRWYGAIRCRHSERGVVTVLAAITLMFMVVPMVGLAVDTGVAYAVKAKIQTGLDGAALGAVRSPSEGLDLSSQQSAATDTAERWFHANIPNGWMGLASVPDPTVTFPTAPPKTIIINVSTSVQVPTYFLRVMNVNSLTITATAQATRRVVNIMLVIDRSGSLYQSSSCTALQAAAASFVNSFINGSDRVGMETFGTDYRLDFAPSLNLEVLRPACRRW